MIKEIKKTILELSRDPKEADTVKALQKQIANMKSSKCKNGEYTSEPFKGCKTCGNTVRVKCKFKEFGYVNSGGCNGAKCDKFESESAKVTKM